MHFKILKEMDTIGKDNRCVRGQTKIDRTFHHTKASYVKCNTFVLVMLTIDKTQKKGSRTCKSRFISMEQMQKYSKQQKK